MINPRVEFGCIFFDGYIYIVGGWKERYLQTTDCYDIKNDLWIQMPDIGEEREDITLCMVNDQFLYMFGNPTSRGRRFKQLKTA